MTILIPETLVRLHPNRVKIVKDPDTGNRPLLEPQRVGRFTPTIDMEGCHRNPTNLSASTHLESRPEDRLT